MPTPLFAWACSWRKVRSFPRNDAVGMPPGFQSHTLNKQVTLGPAFPPSDGPGRTVRAARPAAFPVTARVVACRFGRGEVPRTGQETHARGGSGDPPHEGAL